MPEVNAQFEIWCSQCATGLCDTVSESRRSSFNQGNNFTIDPCSACIETERKDAYNQGYAQGQEDLEHDTAQRL